MKYNQLAVARFMAAAWLLIGVGAAATAAERLLQPFAVKNLNPFMSIHDVSTMQDPVVLEPARSSLDVVLDATSHFTDGGTQAEYVRIDGESYRLALRYTRGLRDRWEVGAEAPLVAHSGGFMDGFINTWHDTFGLPTLGRTQVADNQLKFVYARDGTELVNLQSSASGLGDILLFAGRSIAHTGGAVVTLRAQLKLPTGDADKLLGSGGTDVSASATVSRQWGANWRGAARLGGAFLGGGKVLPELQQNWVGFGSAFVGWRALKTLAFKIQLDAQTPIYADSDLHQLTDPAFQLTVGGSMRIGKSAFIDLGVTEDEINPDVSSDVSIQLRLRTTH